MRNTPLKVSSIEIESKNSVEFLCVELDNKLIFDKQITSICKKVANQLHAICRLQNLMGKMEKEILINGSANTNFNYCLLV